MSPVHVIVGTDPRAEAMWADAFSGAIDLYQFDRNVDAFERLTAAQAPIDLVILTPAQSGPFNLTADQFVARVLEGPLASTPTLANLHIIVVGAQLTQRHPRAISTRTLDAAIRLVKFGEIEDAPHAAAPVHVPVRPQPVAPVDMDLPAGGNFSDNVISRIWAAADSAGHTDTRADAMLHLDIGSSIRGGGPTSAPVRAPMPSPATAARLFATAGTRPAGVAPAVDTRARAAAPVVGGGPAHALANAITAELAVSAPAREEIPNETGLQSARPYQLPGGGAYRGPAMRRNQIPPASSHDAPTAPAVQQAPPQSTPVPPAIGSQIRTMIYANGAQAPADPVLTFSSSAAPVSSITIPTHALPVPPAVAQPIVTSPIVSQPPRAIPAHPPVGVYGGMPAGLIAAQAPVDAPVSAVQADPFVQRAAQDGGVSFG